LKVSTVNPPGVGQPPGIEPVLALFGMGGVVFGIGGVLFADIEPSTSAPGSACFGLSPDVFRDRLLARNSSKDLLSSKFCEIAFWILALRSSKSMPVSSGISRFERSSCGS